MKKLMIVAALMAVGMTASAYEYRWKVGSIAVQDGAGDAAAPVAQGTVAYIFNARNFSQTQLLTAFFDTTTPFDITSKDILPTIQANSSGQFKSNSSKQTDGIGTTYNDAGVEKADTYFAIVAGDKIFVSDTVKTGLDWSAATATTTFQFDPDTHYGNSTATVTFDKAKGFDGNAWYSAGAVPEPTSGLLLLLGVAGLALRRRRA